MFRRFHLAFAAFQIAVLIICLTLPVFGQGSRHQTPPETLTPLQTEGGLPYRIEVSEVDFGEAELPTLHSFAAAHYDGKWILIAGRTNGLHGFDVFEPDQNFPSQFQNRDVWVIDPVSQQSWRGILDTSQGFSDFEVNALTPTNNQFYARGDQLYMIGGYGVVSESNGTENFGTFDTLAAINLPGIINWVQNGTGLASDNIRIIQDPILKVTGGGVFEINGRTHLVVGQDFDGNYIPGSNGTYTRQVRSFDIFDDGTNLSINNVTSTPPVNEYRRRDLNIFPTLRPDNQGGFEQGITALSGFFTPPPGFGAWTVPIEIDENGTPDPGGLPDPDGERTFRQGFNGYHAAKLGLFSESTGQMHEILFGGISLQEYDPIDDIVTADDLLPFVNNITSVVVDAAGNYSQHYLGDFPAIFDLDDNRLRFGANAEFFPNEALAIYNNGVFQLDKITAETTIGHIFGGLIANAPHTRNSQGISAASNALFKVTLIPEVDLDPSSIALSTGSIKSGGLPELLASDNQYLVLDPKFQSFRYQLIFAVEAVSPSSNVNALEFHYESKTFNIVGTVEQKIELFNFALGQFETVDTRLTTSADSVVSITPGGDPNRFLEPGTDVLRARISYQNSLPFWVFTTRNLYLPYRTSVDNLSWTVLP